MIFWSWLEVFLKRNANEILLFRIFIDFHMEKNVPGSMFSIINTKSQFDRCINVSIMIRGECMLWQKLGPVDELWAHRFFWLSVAKLMNAVINTKEGQPWHYLDQDAKPKDWKCSIAKGLSRGLANSRDWHSGGQTDFGTAGQGPGPASDWTETGVSLIWEPCHSQTWQNELGLLAETNSGCWERRE